MATLPKFKLVPLPLVAKLTLHFEERKAFCSNYLEQWFILVRSVGNKFEDLLAEKMENKTTNKIIKLNDVVRGHFMKVNEHSAFQSVRY